MTDSNDELIARGLAELKAKGLRMVRKLERRAAARPLTAERAERIKQFAARELAAAEQRYAAECRTRLRLVKPKREPRR